MYEELLNKAELTLPTHHEKIKIARVIPIHRRVRQEIEHLVAMCGYAKNDELVAKMKALVPEYKSKNSSFEKLDTGTEASTTGTSVLAR